MPGYDQNTALLVVDVQNDFADPRGSLYVEGADELVAFVNAEIDKAQAAGATIVYSRDWHPPATPHFQTLGGIWPEHCVGDTWGSEYYPSLKVVDGAYQIRKGVGGEDGYSAFSLRDPTSGKTSSTELEAILRERGRHRVIVVGLTTDYCAKETAMDAIRLGFDVTILRSGVRAVDLQPGDGERALEAIAAAGGAVE